MHSSFFSFFLIFFGIYLLISRYYFNFVHANMKFN